MNCTETTVNSIRDELRDDISEKLGLQSQQARVRLGDIECVNGVEVTSLVTIGPTASNTNTARRLHLRPPEEQEGGKKQEHSVNLFYALKAESDETRRGLARKLLSTGEGNDSRIDLENPTLFSVRNMKILPGPNDQALFEELNSSLTLKGKRDST